MNNGTVIHSCSSSSLGSSTSSRSTSSDANNNSTFDKDVNTIQAPSQISRKKKPSIKCSSVHPEESYEKSYGVPINTDIGGDIEEGRQPIESGSSPCHEPRRRPKLALLSLLIIIALLITGAAVAAVVVVLGNDQVESNDSAVADKKEPSEDKVVHDTTGTNVSLVLCYFLVPFDRFDINQSYSYVLPS